MWDKPSAGSLRPPPRASGLSPCVLGYFSLSSPGQEPAPPSPETFRRGNMQERPRGSAERGAPHRGPCPLTRHRRAPGGPRAPGPAKGMSPVSLPTSPGTEAQRPADLSAGRPQPWGSGPVPSHRSCSYFRLPPKTHRAPTCSVATQAGMAPSPPLQKLPAADTLHP